MATAAQLRQIVTEARPLVEQWLDIAEQMAGLRDHATGCGFDWSQIKALVKAQVQDDRDETGSGRHVERIIERADNATSYADMLGLAKMNEKNSFADEAAGKPATPVGIPPAPAADHATEAEPVPHHAVEASVATQSQPVHDRHPSSYKDSTAPDRRAGDKAGQHIKRQWRHSDPAHRDCLDPTQCGGFSNLALCERCREAAASERQVAA